MPARRFSSCIGILVLAGVLGGCATQTGRAQAENPAAANAATTSDSLAQTSWTLAKWTAKGGQALPTQSSGGQSPRLDFLVSADRYRVAGDTGCNAFQGSYALAAGNMIIKSPASTRKACPNAGDAALEKSFLDALGKIRTFNLDNAGAPRRMTLTLMDGSTLELNRGRDPDKVR